MEAGRQLEPPPRQLMLDFSRGDQLGMIRDARIPPGTTADGRQVSALLARAVLRAIDDHGRGSECWPSQQRLADMVGCSAKQIQRAVRYLTDTLGVLICRRRRIKGCGSASGNHYTIVWSELALLSRESKVESREHESPPQDQSDQTADQSDQTADQLDILADQSDHLVRYKRSAQRSAKETRRRSEKSSSSSIDSIVRQYAEALDVFLPPPRENGPPRDVSRLLMRSAFLFASIDPAWLVKACRITVRKRTVEDRMDYLRGVLGQRLFEHDHGHTATRDDRPHVHGQLCRCLDAVELPPDEEIFAALRKHQETKAPTP